MSHSKFRGPLTYLRIYTGTLESGSTVFNINKHGKEKISRLMQVYADEHRDISLASAGNIVAVSGLKEVLHCFLI